MRDGSHITQPLTMVGHLLPTKEELEEFARACGRDGDIR